MHFKSISICPSHSLHVKVHKLFTDPYDVDVQSSLIIHPHLCLKLLLVCEFKVFIVVPAIGSGRDN